MRLFATVFISLFFAVPTIGHIRWSSTLARECSDDAGEREQPPAASIRVPEPHAPNAPHPSPAPVMAGGLLRLTPSLYYIVESEKAECMILSSPAGLVSVTPLKTPINVLGRFADSPNDEQEKTYTAKYLYRVKAVGTGKTELLIVPIGSTKESEVIRRTVQVDMGQGPQPPPKPDDDPEPKPDGTSPWTDAGLRVLIVYESSAVTPGQSNVANSRLIRDYLDAKCVKGPDGKQPEYRVLDKDASANGESKFWKEQLAKRKDKPMPWIAIGDGKTGYDGPIPEGVNEALALIKKHGGN